MGIINSLLGIREQFAHLFLGFAVILSPFITHTVLIRYLFTCLDTQQYVMSLGIFCICIMDIVGSHQFQTCIL